jgi:hypothetical protein
MRIGEVAIALLIAASLGWGLYTTRSRGNAKWRMALVAVLALMGLTAGILGLDLSLNRFASTDLRELYVFAAPLALLVGGLVGSVDRRIGWVMLGGLIAVWLLIDLQMYSLAQCPGCPPPPEWRVAGSR